VPVNYSPNPIPEAYCDVSTLESGIIELRQEFYVTNNPDPDAVFAAPSLSFLLIHSESQRNFLFDLGIRKDWANCSPRTVDLIKELPPVNLTQDVVGSLAKGGTSPSEISVIHLSHCHFGHVGDTSPFTESTFLVRAGTSNHLKSGYPTNPDSTLASNTFRASRTEFLAPSSWPSLSPFPRTLDYYGIMGTPACILSNHLGISRDILQSFLARTSSDEAWIYLASDGAHR
jgi:hypothetical protein